MLPVPLSPHFLIYLLPLITYHLKNVWQPKAWYEWAKWHSNAGQWNFQGATHNLKNWTALLYPESQWHWQFNMPVLDVSSFTLIPIGSWTTRPQNQTYMVLRWSEATARKLQGKRTSHQCFQMIYELSCTGIRWIYSFSDFCCYPPSHPTC